MSPSNFNEPITIQRLGVAERAYNNMTLFSSRDNFPDTTSNASLRDDFPEPNGVVYDLDAPGIGVPNTEIAIRRLRQNFLEWATLRSNTNTRLSSDLLWHSAVSVIRTSSTDIHFINDVSGDNSAGTGHINTSWNLQ